MSHPTVSVVVPSRSGAERLPHLLACFQNQTTLDFEVIVVLDGDVDGSERVLAPWREKLPLRVVSFNSNRGRSAALNAGFEAATGSVLVRCDDDLAPGSDFVSRHAASHQAGPVGVVGIYRNVFPDTTYARVYGRHWDQSFRREAAAAPPSQAWRYWAGNVSVERAAWDLVGPYDEAFRAYGWEDVDWGYRLVAAGVPIRLASELETDHLIAATTTRSRCLRAYYSGAARRRFEAKHGLVVMGRPAGVWSTAVRLTSQALTEGGVGRLGTSVDRVAGLVPRFVGRRLIGLGVEASSLAGYRRADAGQAI